MLATSATSAVGQLVEVPGRLHRGGDVKHNVLRLGVGVRRARDMRNGRHWCRRPARRAAGELRYGRGLQTRAAHGDEH
eukprot:scaffold131022_cov51-Phaeocystis_antarctica.AAC.3